MLATIHSRPTSSAFARKHSLLSWDKTFKWDVEVIFSAKYKHLIKGKRRRIFKEAARRSEEFINNLFSGREKPVVIHGDFHPTNVKIHNEEAFALDFEDCGWGYPIQDIAIALLYVRERPNFGGLFNAFKEGYSSKGRWPVHHRKELNTLFMGRLLMIANSSLIIDDFDENFD